MSTAPSADPDARSTSPTAERVYVFGEYRLVPQRQLLLRGSRPVRIGSRALDLLQLLVERQGELVSKEQLIGHAWPDVFVHESNLKVNIAALRRALPQPRGEQPYIATAPGRGYRFVAPVRIETSGRSPTLALVAGGAPDSLPPPHVLFGRDEDLLDLAGMRATSRLLTIVGPAGVGKTSTAVALARQAARDYADGVCFVDLAAIGDARLVCAAIASSLGAGGALNDMLAGVVEALRGQKMLLVLDNCEHVLSAVATVAGHLCETLPDLALIATSREPLGARCETIHVLTPLPAPAEGQATDPQAALAFPAVELFVARANEATGFTLSDAEVPSVAAICRRLDGIPLALELAASRLATHDPARLLAHLSQSFELLSCGPREAPSRHQTLMATLDWSYRLLSAAEARVMRLISVFAGGFTLEDAVALGARADLPAEAIARCVVTLATKSLLSSRFVDGQLRYRLLEATRAYAADRLRHAGEEPAALDAHAQVLLAIFEQAEAEWRWRTARDWTERYGARINDLRKALDWALDCDVATALRLTASAIPLWDELSLVGESRLRVARALALARTLDGVDPALLMKLTVAHAWGFTFSERLDQDGEDAWRESLRLARQTGDIDYELRALWGLAVLLSFTGRHRSALDSLEAFEALATRETDRSAAPDGDRLRAVTAFYCGDIEGAHADLSALARDHAVINHRSRIARFQLDRYVAIRVSLALAAWTRGRATEGKAAAADALAGALAIRHEVSHSNALALAALPISLWEGELDQAQAHLAALVDNLTRREIGIWRPVSRFFAGAIRHARHDPVGLAMMDGALTAVEASNFRVRTPLYASMLAQAALDTGRMDLARTTIAKAQGLVEAQEELWCLPEVLRVRGLIEAREGAAMAAEKTLLGAIEKAEIMGARMFALRAATTLAEVWTQAGRAHEASILLTEIVERFGDSVEGRDLERARRQLARLRGKDAVVSGLG